MGHSFPRIRAIDPSSVAEVEMVASRMRATLVEVLGKERGGSLYTVDWLKRRVLWHLDRESCTGEVFLSEYAEEGPIVGHTIVRYDQDQLGIPIGLFSTTYVLPLYRRQGIATLLLSHGERWMRAHTLSEFATFTAESNFKLINLYRKHGYQISRASNDMVRLAKCDTAGPPTQPSSIGKST